MDIDGCTISIDGIDDYRDLYWLGDIHEGSIGCNRPKVKKAVQLIADNDKAIWFGRGDYAEFINKSDPRFDPKSVDPFYRVCDLGDMGAIQVDRVCELFEPIVDKCKGLIAGNHELKLGKHYDFDVMKRFHERLGVPVYGYTLYYGIQFRRKRSNAHGPSRIRMLMHHGYGGGRLTGSKLNKVIALHQIADAEIYSMGHLHDTAFTPKVKFDMSWGGKLIERDIVYILGGAFLHTYAEGGHVYGEEKAYTPTPHGLERVRITFQSQKNARDVPRCAYHWDPL